VARKRRRYTVAEKVEILEEARAPGSTVAAVLRRHGVDGTTYYRWERQAKEGVREALNGKRRDRGRKDREIERLQEELTKKREIIAEVVQENLELKRGLSE
jgi:transposase